MSKETLFFLDSETSGLDATRHGIVQIAWIIEKDGEIMDESVYDVALDPKADISMGAIDCNGFTIERMKSGKHISVVLAALSQHLRSSTINTKAVIIGHKVQFDIDFLKKAIHYSGEKVGYYLDYSKFVDTRAVLQWYGHLGKIMLPNYKLVTACEYFKIPLKPHDALEDIRATRSLYYKLRSL